MNKLVGGFEHRAFSGRFGMFGLIYNLFLLNIDKYAGSINGVAPQMICCVPIGNDHLVGGALAGTASTSAGDDAGTSSPASEECFQPSNLSKMRGSGFSFTDLAMINQ